MLDTSIADRCRGVLIGLAAGDCIGGPIRMATLLAESLLDCGGFNPANILDRYSNWWKDGAFDTGPVSARVLAHIAAGNSPTDAVGQVHQEFGGQTAGCNPAHRSPPLAMFAAIADEDLEDRAQAQARLTHHDPLAGEVAASVTRLCRLLIRGQEWDKALRMAGIAVAAEPGRAGGYAPDVLQAAAYFVGSSRHFVDAIDRAIALAGPANYCPVLVGAIAGARWGASTIPRPLLAHVDLIARVEAAADSLAAGWS